jgi:hypothetical protein
MTEEKLQKIITSKYKTNHRASLDIVTIPVVFHVLYNNAPSDVTNISDAQILSQIDVLNEDFRGQNSDIGNVPYEFFPYIADIEVEFCLASVNPSGNPTSGITRRQTTITQFNSDDDDCKFDETGGTDIWNSQEYLNIWVVPDIITNDGYDDLLGYAQFPGMDPETDGVVIVYKYIGRTPENPFSNDYNLGRTTTHEIGHWLDLFHVFGFGEGCLIGDQCDDTPNQDTANYNCPTFPQTDDCTPYFPGVMFMNYMDWVDDDCMMMFTHDQKDRMRGTLDDERLSITEADNCCQDTWTIGYLSGQVTFEGGIQSYYKAVEQVNGKDVIVESGAEIIMQAGSRITFNEEFRAKIGSFLIATIGDCDTLVANTQLIDD